MRHESLRAHPLRAPLHRTPSLPLLLLLALAATASVASPERAEDPPEPIGATRDLGVAARSILEAHCAACHTPGSNALGPVEYDGDFDAVLDFARLRRSAVFDPTNPEGSDLWWVVTQGEMPPTRVVDSGHADALATDEVDTLVAWMRAGAPDADAPAEPDPTAIEAGRSAFYASCTACHPASRALGRALDAASWRDVIERMAEKPEARIDPDDVDAIAAFLADRGAKRMEAEGPSVSAAAAGDWWDDLRVHGTASILWRDSGRAERVENPDFVPELWMSAEWHPDELPLSARVTACTTCHAGADPGAGPVEFAEAALRLDLDRVFHAQGGRLQAGIDAGRFVVPFGGFSARSNPAAYRTVTRPLLYNMGQLVDRGEIGAAVLPMPYSDEGVKVDVRAPIAGDVSVQGDIYVVNGLQGNIGVDFFQSRSYSDNNGDPALGGRVSVGTSSFSVGASAMAGNSESSSGTSERIGYDLVGVDLNARIGERLRIVAEAARRRNDQLTFQPASPVGTVDLEGYVVETDFLLSRSRSVSLVARLDATRYEGTVAPITSSLAPSFRVERFTWGFDIGLFAGSNLMLNHEHWSMPEGLDDVDVIGLRWVASF